MFWLHACINKLLVFENNDIIAEMNLELKLIIC